MNKKFYIHTLGCKVNQYESQAMREALMAAGFSEAFSRDDAGILIVNTCTVTAEADRESRNILRAFKKNNPDGVAVAAGCAVDGSRKEPGFNDGISYVIRNRDKDSIASILKDDVSPENNIISDRAKKSGISFFKGHSKAYMKIQDGCENRCSYCKVALVRGKLYSKPLDDIRKEFSRLVANGYKEIILTGICLGAWGKDISDGFSLLDVLNEINSAGSDARIRLSSIEPKYVTTGLLDYMAANNNICAHLHIPFQSGDNDVLEAMNRPYTHEAYLAIVEKARAKIPELAITTDILIGFPGETDTRFKNTLSFLRRVKPSRTHIFTFSKREGTPAFHMKYDIDRKELANRYKEAYSITKEYALKYSKDFIGRKLNILVEEKRDRSTGLFTGYSDNYIKVVFSADDAVSVLPGSIVSVMIKEVSDNKVTGIYGK